MASETHTPTVLPPARLAHLVLRTNKLHEMIEFWRIFTGSEIIFENEMIAFLSYDEEHHRIAIAALPETIDKVNEACGLAHVAFTYDTMEDLATAYEQRKKFGFVPFWCINHGTTTSMYYHDPDGNEIEMQIDNFEDPRDATEYMNSEAFRTNAYGTEFNPDDFVRRVRSGEDQEQIKTRPDIGPRPSLGKRFVPPPLQEVA